MTEADAPRKSNRHDAATLDELVAALQRIAPLKLAAEWDNVGLLVAPSQPQPIARALLTIDLTEPVLEEAIERGAGLVVAYHPPIFKPLSRLTSEAAKSRLVLRAIERGMAVYSPHTALDAAPGGVNDWLAEGLGEGERRPIEPHADLPPSERFKLVVFVPADDVDRLRDALSAAGAGVIGNYSHCTFNLAGQGTFLGGETTDPAVGRRGRLERVDEVHMEMVCSAEAMPAAVRTLVEQHPYEEPAYEIYALAPRPRHNTGQGRVVTLREPAPLTAIVDRIKRHLGLEHVRLAVGDGRTEDAPIRTIALCPGAGGSVLTGEAADLYLTGEMRHHDVLDANARGTSVILTDHTHTERGYLPTLRRRLADELDGRLDVTIAEQDADPLRIV